IDECSQANMCHADATCTNTPGSYLCTCNTGYTGIGTYCVDIDECSQANMCHADSTCTNTPGSYLCSCNTGYTGNGTYCVDIDECSQANMCHADATCTNTPGSYLCTCNTGYTGNGTYCVDINECSQANMCHAEATCTNTPGTYVCTCNTGYTGDGTNCADAGTEIPIFNPSGNPATVPIEEAVPFEVVIRIEEIFVSELQNKQSQAFRNLRNRFLDFLLPVYQNQIGFIGIIINSFSNGSIVADIDILYNSSEPIPTAEEVQSPIAEARDNGSAIFNISSLQVQRE
ncbi:fibrillin-2-like isoform X48, partial [Paramuricea clavata]